MSAVVAIFLVVLLFRIFTRHARPRVVQPAVQVIIVQPGQVPQPQPAAPSTPVQSQYSRPFSAGFLGLNRQN